MSVTVKSTTLPPVTIFTGTSALSNNTNVLSSAIDFTQSNVNINGYLLGRYILSGVAGGVPSTSTGWSIYHIPSLDGVSIFDTDPGRNSLPVVPQAAVIPASSGDNNSFVRSSSVIDAPSQLSKVLFHNNGTGQQLSAGWTLQFIPITYTG